MAKIKIDIDSENATHEPPIHPKGPRLTAAKVGLLSSIDISSDLQAAFTDGFGSSNNGKKLGLGYGSSALRQGKKDLKNLDHCGVIATIGGDVVFKAIKDQNDNPPFVSVFGTMPDLTPDNIGNCYGGVSLSSWQSNADRITYLTGKLQCNANEIGLYYNPNSAMSPLEVQNWDMISPPVQGVPSSKAFSGAAAGPPPTNDPSRFAVDLAPAGGFFPARVRVLVISADPFFQQSKQQLITAANTWISGDPNNRYVCYPLQDYQNITPGPQPTANRSTLYGPDLTTVYRLLGFLAQVAADNNNAGFFTAANLIKDLK
jgi:hypothetical protein